jgi:predicted ArsR family transcriptional regulator
MTLELVDIKGLQESKAIKDNTRRQILEYLKVHGRATVDEIATAAGITAMGVRRHLLALESADLVKMELERRPMGRPTHVYQLTESADTLFPKTYHQLALSLLDSLVETDGEQKITQLFDRRKKKLIATYAERMKGKDLEGRVAELARIMTENGYMASWKKIDDGYAITEHNCAIFHIAQRFDQPCLYELEFIKELLGRQVEVTREFHMASGDTCCAYVIREKSSSTVKKSGRQSSQRQSRG